MLAMRPALSDSSFTQHDGLAAGLASELPREPLLAMVHRLGLASPVLATHSARTLLHYTCVTGYAISLERFPAPVMPDVSRIGFGLARAVFLNLHVTEQVNGAPESNIWTSCWCSVIDRSACPVYSRSSSRVIGLQSLQ